MNFQTRLLKKKTDKEIPTEDENPKKLSFWKDKNHLDKKIIDEEEEEKWEKKKRLLL